MRPAVNVGLSVSRVGGSAQRAAIRQISGQLRVNLAQYRELAIFMQFGSDLDAATAKTLSRGAKMTDALKQRQYRNYSVRDMVILLTVSQSELVDKVPERRMTAFIEGLPDYIRVNHAQLLEELDPDSKLTDEMRGKILAAAAEYVDCSVGAAESAASEPAAQTEAG